MHLILPELRSDEVSKVRGVGLLQTLNLTLSPVMSSVALLVIMVAITLSGEWGAFWDLLESSCSCDLTLHFYFLFYFYFWSLWWLSSLVVSGVGSQFTI